MTKVHDPSARRGECGTLAGSKHLARLKHQHFALVRGIDVVEIELAFELIENFIAFVDVELFAAIGAAVNDRDEVRVRPDGSAPAPISSVLFNPLLKIEFAQMWKHICAWLS